MSTERATPTESQVFTRKLFLVRQEFPKIVKKREGSTGGRAYKYADLEDILDVITPILNKYHLFFQHTSSFADGAHLYTTKLVDVESDLILTDIRPMPIGVGPQEMGKWETYWRRYAITGLLGLCGEEDTDAQGIGHGKSVRPNPGEGSQTFAKRQAQQIAGDPGDYVISFGKKYMGKRLRDIHIDDLTNFAAYIEDSAKSSGKGVGDKAKEFLQALAAYSSSGSVSPANHPQDGDIPF